MSLYVIEGFLGGLVAKIDNASNILASTGIPLPDDAPDFPSITIAPDGRLYYFRSEQLDIGEPVWYSTDANLTEDWTPGPVVTTGFNGFASSGVFTKDGKLNVACTTSVTDDDDALIRFDPVTGDNEIVATFFGAGGASEIGTTSDGVNVFCSAFTSSLIHRITPSGEVSVAMDGGAYTLCAPAVYRNTIFAFGTDSSLTEPCAVLAGSVGQPPTPVVTWDPVATPSLPKSTRGAGLMQGSTYVFSGGEVGGLLEHCNIGRYSGGVLTAQPGFDVITILATSPSTSQAPLRQFPRDDFLTGAPRQDRSSTSVNVTARQGYTNTYR